MSRFSLRFQELRGVSDSAFFEACNSARDEILAVIQRALTRQKEAHVGKQQTEDLSDIFGDEPPATKKEKGMASKQKVNEAVAASKAKHTPKTNGKEAPAKANGKAAPAKAAAAKAPKAAAQRGGSGKFYFPVGSKEREALKAKVAGIKKAASTKEVAKALKTETWKVRLVAVELVAVKKLKMVKDGNSFTIQPK